MARCSFCHTPHLRSACPVCGTPASPARAASPATTGTASTAGNPAWSTSAQPAHTAGASPVPVASTPRVAFGASLLRGTVRRSQPPTQMDPRTDLFRLGTLGFITLILLPFVAALCGVRLALSFMTPCRGGGGVSTLGPALAHSAMGSLLHDAREKWTVYHYVVDTGSDLVSVRQEDEFLDGRLVEGHDVTLSGTWRNGTFFVHEGRDDTLGSRFTRRTNPWKISFLALAILFGGFLLASLGSAS